MSRGSARLLWVAAWFLGISVITRVGLTLFSGETYSLFEWLRLLLVGTFFDLCVLPCFLLPWALYDLVVPAEPKRHWAKRFDAIWAGLWGTGYLVLFLFTAAAEFVFWGEFASRFDFIAVDYLVYTHEVLGNITESYPVGLWFSGVAAGAAIIWYFTWPKSKQRPPIRWPYRWGRAALVGGAVALGMTVANFDFATDTDNSHVGQLSLNGVFALFHAYRHNELDYEQYYPTVDAKTRDGLVRDLVQQKNSTFLNPQGIDRDVVADHPMRHVNVVLISVESLSAAFMGKFGDTQNLTPNLDRLADEGLFFTNLYATGTRTVRGLEALSVGTPPTPGQSIVRRPRNIGLENVGEEFAEGGWKTYWIYGGYGIFDNMNAYFGANGYQVVDRSDVDDEKVEIHAENVWGIADEDLYTLAMRKFDKSYAAGQPFYAHIMTTSNHRPYTFPEDRVPLPQKHREGAVQYTDWAIGDFLKRASTKPWFDSTLFIITADHTSKAAGKTDLPPSRYHIPMIWYAPKLIPPQKMTRLMSQIDIVPTLMGWMGFSYDSRFFGYDMFKLEPGRERAFISTYQKLGYMKDGRLVVLDVKKPPIVKQGIDIDTPANPKSDAALIDEAITWYQTASEMFNNGLLKDLNDVKPSNGG